MKVLNLAKSAAIIGLALVSACSEEAAAPAGTAVLSAENFTVRLNPAPGRPAGGYGVIKGPASLALTQVTSAEVGRIELHIMEDQGGAMRMKKVDALLIDSDGTLTFEPGGRHLMLFDIAEVAVDDGQITLTAEFADSSSLTTEAQVKR